jgi:hypothetical protein
MSEYDRWKNRRRMAWICMMAAIGYPVLVLFTESRELGEIATPFYMFVSAVVGAYIGFATWEDNSRRRRPDYNRRYDNDPLIEPEDFRDNRRY